MKYLLIGAAVIAITAAIAMNVKKPVMEKQHSASGSFEPVAVIELFTSQGCSSCPSADKLLAKTLNDAAGKSKNIYALSFHVDYWNRLGWKDPFSSAAFTQRQGEYVSALNLSGAYTPQMVVNGNTEFVGSEEYSLSHALLRALSAKAAVSFTKLNIISAAGEAVKVQYALDGNYAGATINIALVSLSETTSIRSGENGGRTLSNDNIVRQLVTKTAGATGEIDFSSTPSPAKKNMAVIAFVQQANNGTIIGAAETK